MSNKAEPIGSRVTAIALALTILVTGCVITLWLNNWQQSSTERRVSERFLFAASDAASLIERRLQHYENLLMGARGLFVASERLDRKEFSDYARSIELRSRFPAAIGLGYAQVVKPEDRWDYEETVQAEGFPDFKIWPNYERELFTSIHFIEPFSGVNLKAFGYDMFAEHERNKAMERAMLQDTTALSRHVALVQDSQLGNYPGILIYVPFYGNTRPLVTPEQRRKAIQGWVYSVVRADLLISQTLTTHHPELQVSVHDGRLPHVQSSELYSTENEEERTESPLKETIVIAFGGREWSLVVGASPAWIADAGLSGVDYRLFAGVFLSVALAIFLYLTSLGKSNALELVRRQTDQLQMQHDTLRVQTAELKENAWRLKSEAETRRKAESEALSLDSILHELSSEFYLLSADNRLSIRRANQVAEKRTGLMQDQLKKETLYDRFDARFTKTIKARVEQMLRAKLNHCTLDVELSSSLRQGGVTETIPVQLQFHLFARKNRRVIGVVVLDNSANDFGHKAA